jgi:hypothetical protein
MNITASNIPPVSPLYNLIPDPNFLDVPEMLSKNVELQHIPSSYDQNDKERHHPLHWMKYWWTEVVKLPSKAHDGAVQPFLKSRSIISSRTSGISGITETELPSNCEEHNDGAPFSTNASVPGSYRGSFQWRTSRFSTSRFSRQSKEAYVTVEASHLLGTEVESKRISMPTVVVKHLSVVSATNTMIIVGSDMGDDDSDCKSDIVKEICGSELISVKDNEIVVAIDQEEEFDVDEHDKVFDHEEINKVVSNVLKMQESSTLQHTTETDRSAATVFEAPSYAHQGNIFDKVKHWLKSVRKPSVNRWKHKSKTASTTKTGSPTMQSADTSGSLSSESSPRNSISSQISDASGVSVKNRQPKRFETITKRIVSKLQNRFSNPWNKRPSSSVSSGPSTPSTSSNILVARPASTPQPPPTLESMLVTLSADKQDHRARSGSLCSTTKPVASRLRGQSFASMAPAEGVSVPVVAKSALSAVLSTHKPINNSDERDSIMSPVTSFPVIPAETTADTAVSSTVQAWLLRGEGLTVMEECERCEGTQFLKDGTVCMLCSDTSKSADLGRLGGLWKIDTDEGSVTNQECDAISKIGGGSGSVWDLLSGGSIHSGADEDNENINRYSGGSQTMEASLSNTDGSAREKWRPQQMAQSIRSWFKKTEKSTEDDESSETGSFVLQQTECDSRSEVFLNPPEPSADVLEPETYRGKDTFIAPDTFQTRTIRRLRSFPVLISRPSVSELSKNSTENVPETRDGSFKLKIRRWGSLRRRPGSVEEGETSRAEKAIVGIDKSSHYETEAQFSPSGRQFSKQKRPGSLADSHDLRSEDRDFSRLDFSGKPSMGRSKSMGSLRSPWSSPDPSVKPPSIDKTLSATGTFIERDADDAFEAVDRENCRKNLNVSTSVGEVCLSKGFKSMSIEDIPSSSPADWSSNTITFDGEQSIPLSHSGLPSPLDHQNYSLIGLVNGLNAISPVPTAVNEYEDEHGNGDVLRQLKAVGNKSPVQRGASPTSTVETSTTNATWTPSEAPCTTSAPFGTMHLKNDLPAIADAYQERQQIHDVDSSAST